MTTNILPQIRTADHTDQLYLRLHANIAMPDMGEITALLAEVRKLDRGLAFALDSAITHAITEGHRAGFKKAYRGKKKVA